MVSKSLLAEHLAKSPSLTLNLPERGSVEKAAEKARAAGGEVIIVDGLAMDAPTTPASEAGWAESLHFAGHHESLPVPATAAAAAAAAAGLHCPEEGCQPRATSVPTTPSRTKRLRAEEAELDKFSQQLRALAHVAF